MIDRRDLMSDISICNFLKKNSCVVFGTNVELLSESAK